MISDGISNPAIPMASSNPRDFAKKKRANRSAKLKQCKLDARREQWLSQVKSKGAKEELNGGGGTTCGSGMDAANEKGQVLQKLEIKSEGEEDNGGLVQDHHNSDLPANSPTNSVLEGSDSGTNFTGSNSRSSCSSGGCCSRSMSEEDEERDDVCFDDWEAVADALAITDKKQEQPTSPCLDDRNDNLVHLSSQSELSSCQVSDVDISKSKLESGGLAPILPKICQAWRPDDAFRPQSLPNLSKQYSFPLNSGRHFRGGSVWERKNLSVPTSCPICYEDLDLTDTSFLPCSCGFRLCLFCHKRILEEDGRCPGCRKQYNHDPVDREATMDGGCLTVRLARSCSMISRS
nr:TPRXL isoform X1 [Ipomoea batatas]